MSKKISLEDLMSKLANTDVAEDELGAFFVLDEENSGAFSPVFKLNSKAVTIPRGKAGVQRSALILNFANFYARIRRENKFNKKIASGYRGPIIVTEGDSWFQYPITLKDTIDCLMDKYAVKSLGAAGDLLRQIAKKREYIQALRETGASIFLLSGGGNDLVADGGLADHLEKYHKDLKPEDYLKRSFQALLDDAFGHYERIVRDVGAAFPHVRVLCHGYDYPIPKHGRWLGKPMEKRGIKDAEIQKGIACCMMDQFNRGIRRLCDQLPNATYIDCRNVVGEDRWHDELHPVNSGYSDVAAKFANEIDKLVETRSVPVFDLESASKNRAAPIFTFPGAFGAPNADVSAAAEAVATEKKAGPKTWSLHVGINRVNPDHYAGWDGALKACENDAYAMQKLATHLGYDRVELLLTENATRDAVVEKIKAAAENLQSGDMFVMTVSCHGGKLPDLNKDELDGDGDDLDETLLLYDFMIADDELYALWSEFDEGVRILMVPDTCHSGSMVRDAREVSSVTPWGNVTMPPGAPVPASSIEVRAAPQLVLSQTFLRNTEAYQRRADQFSQIRESVIMSPQSPIKASVLNLGACQDDQYARDGEDHGAFTGALLLVWNRGRFNGDYVKLVKNVTAAINRPDQKPHLKQVGAVDPSFKLQKPFCNWSATPTEYDTIAPSPKSLENRVIEPVGTGLISGIFDAEGEMEEELTEAQIKALFDEDPNQAATRSAALASWPLYADFKQFIDALELEYFSANEFLFLGDSNKPGGSCAGKNQLPDPSLWSNISMTARALDALRKQLDKPIRISNGYRHPPYNRCIGGASRSQHTRFCALDFVVKGMSTTEVAKVLRKLRDEDKLFYGGIGRYNSFVHIDTRGVNRTW